MPASWEEEHLRTTVCQFPKHKFTTWYDVCAEDTDYVQWLLDNVLDPEDEEELRDALTWGITHVPTRF